MKLHVLGYWGTYPGPGEATTGFLVETDNERILLDCGSGVLAQLFKICSVKDLTGVVITHHHHDHVADLGTFIYAVLLARLTGQRTTPLPIYMPRGASELMQEMEQEPLIELHIIDDTSTVEIGDVHLSFAKTVHAVYCLAVRFEEAGKRFVFSADSSVCVALTAIAKDADLFLCEASMFDGQEATAKQTGHLTARQAGEVAKSAGVKRLVLTHYPHYGDIDQLVAEASGSYGKAVGRIATMDVLTI